MYKVLIVEDDPMVSMINEQYVRRNKKFFVAGVCRDGKNALEFLDIHDIDLIILDVFMPHQDGFETLRQIRKKQMSVDVIMVTAANDRESLEEALHLGIVDYLVKPFTFDRFCMALDKFIAQRNALNELGTLNQKSIDFIIDSLLLCNRIIAKQLIGRNLKRHNNVYQNIKTWIFLAAFKLRYIRWLNAYLFCESFFCNLLFQTDLANSHAKIIA